MLTSQLTACVQDPEHIADMVKFSAFGGMIMLLRTPLPTDINPARCCGGLLV